MKSKRTLTQKAFALFTEGKDNAFVASALKMPRQHVGALRWNWKNPEKAREIRIARWRRLGRRPMKEVRSQLAALTDERAAKIEPLLAKGMSWREAAAKLGITKNVIAGVLYRKRRQNAKRAEAA